jgi:hypothetical protein
MSDFRTPISELTEGPQDMADGLNLGNVAPRLVPSVANYAEDPAVKARAINEIYPLVQQSRMDRKAVEEGWASIRRMANMQHDENQKYIGRSNVYLPVHAKNINSQVTSLVRGLFPSDEYLEATLRGPAELDMKERSANAKHFMQYQFEQQAMLRMYMKLFSRQLLDYGFSVLKFWYRSPKGYTFGKPKKMTQENLWAADFVPDDTDQGLTVSARNIMNFYAYPFGAETLRETILQFEDIRMSMAELAYWAKAGGWLKDVNLETAPTPSQVSTDEAELAAIHGTPPEAGQATGTKLGQAHIVTEVYTFLELPASEYTQHDAKGCPLPVRIIFLGDQPVSIKRNPNYHQSAPYLGLSLNASPGFMLGYGPGKMIAGLQYLANDFMNQTNDNCIYGLNPIIKAVPGMLSRPLAPIKPGVTWYMNDLSAVELLHPPTDQLQWGVQMAQMMVAMGQDFGGSPPISQGTSAGGGAKTATGSQILQRNAAEPMQDLIEDISTEVLVPLAQRGYKLCQQYSPEKVMADVFGVMKEITRDNELQYDASFRWLAANQASNSQARAFQATQFLQMVAGPVAQQLATQGMMVNYVPILKKIWMALGFRGFDDVIKMLPMQPGMGAGMPPGAPGAMPPQAPGDRPRSTLEQIPGGGAGMQEGEGEAFGEVRANADDLAGMLGGMGGEQ